MEKIIEVTGLRKRYGSFEAVRGISFYVEKGKLFSFLGPNGAGKSTTIDVLCTLGRMDGGEVRIGGMDLTENRKAVRKRIGVVFQNNVLDDLLTVRENLIYRAGLYASDRGKIRKAVYEAAQETELGEFLDRPYGKLSGGQRRRADIARALVHAPEILFLDEPTTGLDPQTRCGIWSTIRQLQERTGMTVFLTTHYMEEAAQSDYILVIDHGEIAAKGTPAELKTRYASDLLKMSASDEAALTGLMRRENLSYTVSAGEVTVRLPDTMAALPLLERCRSCISGFQVLQGTMDDAFLGIVGREVRE
jgi:multidrug/hemolysin transport system ATP-binding protein